MRRVVALLAAASLASVAPAACGGSGAEPGASREATVVLDFQANAVHSGIYAALRNSDYENAGIDLTVREPGAATDAPKLLASGRAQFAVLDIHDLGLAREKGIDIVGVVPIVQRPLASVLARGDVASPRDLEGERVGVTGLPSDDAVLDSVLTAGGGNIDAVERVTIGFNAVSALAAGRVSGATAFWNAEGVALRRQGVPITEFRVDEYGAPKYPELILCASRKLLDDDPALVKAMAGATTYGYEAAVADPDSAIGALTDAVPAADPGEVSAEMRALTDLDAFSPPGRLDRKILEAWGEWDAEHGILAKPPSIPETFPLAGT